MLHRASLLLAVLATAPILAQATKSAWEWTVEERLARRFDPVAIRTRFDRAAAEGLTGGEARVRANAELRDIPNVVVGRHNPELFFPFELFPYLVRSGFAADEAERERSRDRFASVVSEFSEPARFWTALESAVEPYLLNQREEEKLAARLGTALSRDERSAVLREIAAVQIPQCALRQEAIENAANRIGRTNLYRVLYEAVAPTLSVSAGEGELDPSRIRFIAGGCK